jgi:carbohydrate-selective porin OprB
VSCAPAEYSGEPTHGDKFTYLITPQPSVQYFVDPGGDQRARKVLVLALRTRIRLD